MEPNIKEVAGRILKSRRCAYSFSHSLAIARCEDEMEKSFCRRQFLLDAKRAAGVEPNIKEVAGRIRALREDMDDEVELLALMARQVHGHVLLLFQIGSGDHEGLGQLVATGATGPGRASAHPASPNPR